MRFRRVLVCLVGLLASWSLQGVFAGDWPQWRYDAARSAASPDELPAELHLRWVRQLGEPRPAWPASQPSLRFDVSYSPVAAGKLLYVPSMVTDSVTAYDTETGQQRWRFFAEGPVRFAPIFSKGRLYFGSDDGLLYCLDAVAGSLLWKFRAGPSDRKILGNERMISTWPIRGGPVLNDKVVYLTAGIWPFMGIFVHAVDAETGKPIWTNSGDSISYQINPHGSPAFGGLVPRGHLAVTEKGLLAPGGRTPPGTYDLETGRLISFNFAHKGGRSQHRTVAIKAGAKTYTPDEGSVSCDGWKGAVDGTPWNVLAADDKLFVVTCGGDIYCFAEKQGEPKTYDAPPAGWIAGHDKWDRQAGEILRAAKLDGGYGLVLGIGSGNLAEALLRKSRLHIIVIDPDAKKIDAFRRKMLQHGVYGTRVVAHVGNPSKYPWPPYLAGVVVSEDFRSAAGGNPTALVKNLFRGLRPYGGTACLPVDAKKLRGPVEKANLENALLEPIGKDRTLLVRQGALSGAADWTHNYGDAGNSVVSKDSRVRLPLGLLWFGGPPNDEILPRHGHGPSPQVAAGRLFIEGADMLRAIDIYTGRLLWQKQLPGLGEFHNRTNHQPGAGEIGSNYVSLSDAVYVVYGDTILVLDAATGRTLNEIELEATWDDPEPNWGGISAWEDLLIATATPAKIDSKPKMVAKPDDPATEPEPDPQPPSPETFFAPVRYASASRRLVVMDRGTGKVLWERKAKYNFRHNNIAVGADKVFCIDALSAAKLNSLKRRGIEDSQYEPRLMALDVRTGKEIWSTTEDVFGTFLNYSQQHDVLLQAGSRNRDRARDETGTGMVAYRGGDGAVLWKDLERSHDGPCMLHRDTIIAQGPAYRLLTGEPKTRRNPLTGEPLPWQFTRNYGCNTATAAEHLILFRSAAAGYFDLSNDAGTGNFGGFKSGCTSNMIAAGGLLVAPEYTRTCTCNYQNQTSLAMIHDPDVETWTFNDFTWGGEPIKRVGINFGAPGDRLDKNDTLWLDFPSRGGPSPDIPVAVEGEEVSYFRYHSSRVEADTGSGELNWVAACGLTGATGVMLTLAGDGQARKYTLRLHFAEVEDVRPGDRLFSIALQDEELLEDFDVLEAAGGRNRAVVKEFRGVEVTDRLKISLVPVRSSAILSGIEVAAE